MASILCASIMCSELHSYVSLYFVLLCFSAENFVFLCSLTVVGSLQPYKFTYKPLGNMKISVIKVDLVVKAKR